MKSIRKSGFGWDDLPIIWSTGLILVLILILAYALWVYGIEVPPTRKEEALKRKVDSLTVVIKTQDRVIATQRQHFDSCSYISRGQIKKVVNKYWIELRKDGEIW